jgi:hypothetical protein
MRLKKGQRVVVGGETRWMGGRSGDHGLFCAGGFLLFSGKLSGTTAYVGRGDGGVVEGKEGKTSRRKVGCFSGDGCVNKGWERKMGEWVRNDVESGKI